MPKHGLRINSYLKKRFLFSSLLLTITKILIILYRETRELTQTKQSEIKMTTEQIIEHYETQIKSQVENETFEEPKIEENTFAYCCTDSNSENELADCLIDFNHDAPDSSADKTDCETHGITATEWFDEIEKALISLIAYRLEVI